MQYIQPTQSFSFNYTTFDQNTGLYLRAAVYDVTSGVSFVGNVVMMNGGNGVYTADYSATIGHTYLVIAVVYTDGTYATVDTSRAASTEFYQALNNSVTTLYFDYTTFDQNAGLYLGAKVFDVTSGEVSEGLVQMTYVAFGVYIGSYTGTLNHTYLVSQFVFTSNSYATIDTTRSPNANNFQCWNLSSVGGVSVDPGIANVSNGVAYEINGVPLVGTLQVINNLLPQAALIGQSLVATLKPTGS